MQIQTWHPPLWLCTHAKYYVKSGLTNVLKNANKTKNMHLFSIRIANYMEYFCIFQTFETVLKSWSEKQKLERPLSPQPPSLNQDETVALQTFVEVSSSLIKL